MLTLFHILEFAAPIAGGFVGYHIGVANGSSALGIIGAAVGIAVGWIVGRIPFAISFGVLRRSLAASSVAELHARLEQEYFISHLIIAELVRRGEPLNSVREIVVRQLASTSYYVKKFGHANARLWFPDLISTPPGA